MTVMASKRLIKEIAELCENFQIGIYMPTNPANRTIYTGLMPDDLNEGLLIVESISPPPHTYVDTEYTVLDFWSRSPSTERGHALLEMVYNNFHRRYGYQTLNWNISFSHALGGIVDIDRQEGSKLFRLSVQFICRNLNNLS